jgi:uncharacterized protein (TIGR00299 family) protein
MRTLYIDCSMGAAGDMLTAALLELLPDPDGFVKELNALGIPGVALKKEKAVKSGITGTQMIVTVNGVDEGCGHEHGHEHDGHVHHYSSMHDIEHIVRDHLNVSKKVKDNVMSVYSHIAEAESHAHGVPVTDIHFHEVGTMDAIADITAVCMLIEKIEPDEIVASPVHVGSGQVKCAHGILPVPAPATAYILKDVPIYGGSVKGELCTPTGAALLKHFADRFADMPVMKVRSIGYGMGKKDFDTANCLRVMLGETGENPEEITEICCNIDDMTGEEIGFAMDRLFEAGAVDVYTVPIGMKKSRPGILLHAMCREAEKEAVIRAMFKYTTTIGIRENLFKRHVLSRSIEEADTPYGKVRRKVSQGYGVCKEKYEYGDIARIAKENGISIEEAKKLIK